MAIAIKALKFGTSGNDVLTSSGTSGNLQLIGFGGDDKLTGGLNVQNVLEGGDGNDNLTGGSLADEIYGGNGVDRAYGEAGDDLIYGGSGGDLLHGGSGNDQLFGESGEDFLLGATGSDSLHGGAGSDGFLGGSGADKFYLGAGDNIIDTVVFFDGDNAGTAQINNAGSLVLSGQEKIFQFELGKDKIDLSTFGGGFTYDQQFSQNSGKSIYLAQGVVLVDHDADALYDLIIQVDNNLKLSASDFIFM